MTIIVNAYNYIPLDFYVQKKNYYQMEKDKYSINPLQILGLKESDTQNIAQIKLNFKDLSVKYSENNQQRALINVAYDALADTYYKGKRYKKNNSFYQIINNTDIPFLILSNDFEKVKKYYDSKLSQINKILSPVRFTPLYLSCRAGHYTIAQYFLMNGAKILKQQASTPMHAACYFGHKKIIHLLYNYGIRADVKNDSTEYNGKYPIEQTQKDSEIYRMLQEINTDKIFELMGQLKKSELTQDNLKILTKSYKNFKQKEVCKKIINTFYEKNKNKFQDAYETCFHGTKFEFVKSIFQKGLKPAGFKQDQLEILLNSGRINLSLTVDEIKNWGKAVFLSPSIFYAADPNYSQVIFSNGENWCTIIEAKVKKGCYTKHNHTFYEYHFKNLEPASVQLRVSGKFFKKEQQLLYLSNGQQPVIVVSVTFILSDYLNSLQNFHDADIFKYDSQTQYLELKKRPSSPKSSRIKIIKRGNSNAKN